MIYITSINCKVSLFPRSGKNEVILCICVFIYTFDFISMKWKISHQHLLFARSTNNYLIFLVALPITIFTNAFYFHEVEKSLMIYLTSI